MLFLVSLVILELDICCWYSFFFWDEDNYVTFPIKMHTIVSEVRILFCNKCSAVLLFFFFIYLLCVSFKPGFIIFVNLHLEATTRSSSQVFTPLNRCECWNLLNPVAVKMLLFLFIWRKILILQLTKLKANCKLCKLKTCDVKNDYWVERLQ